MVDRKTKGPTREFTHAPDCKIVKADPGVKIAWQEVETGLWVAECRCGKEYEREAPGRRRLNPHDPATFRHIAGCQQAMRDPDVVQLALKVQEREDYWWIASACGCVGRRRSTPRSAGETHRSGVTGFFGTFAVRLGLTGRFRFQSGRAPSSTAVLVTPGACSPAASVGLRHAGSLPAKHSKEYRPRPRFVVLFPGRSSVRTRSASRTGIPPPKPSGAPNLRAPTQRLPFPKGVHSYGNLANASGFAQIAVVRRRDGRAFPSPPTLRSPRQLSQLGEAIGGLAPGTTGGCRGPAPIRTAAFAPDDERGGSTQRSSSSPSGPVTWPQGLTFSYLAR